MPDHSAKSRAGGRTASARAGASSFSQKSIVPASELTVASACAASTMGARSPAPHRQTATGIVREPLLQAAHGIAHHGRALAAKVKNADRAYPLGADTRCAVNRKGVRRPRRGWEYSAARGAAPGSNRLPDRLAYGRQCKAPSPEGEPGPERPGSQQARRRPFLRGHRHGRQGRRRRAPPIRSISTWRPLSITPRATSVCARARAGRAICS